MLTFSEKATKIDKIFTVNLTVCSNRQIDSQDFVNVCGLLRKHELYYTKQQQLYGYCNQKSKPNSDKVRVF